MSGRTSVHDEERSGDLVQTDDQKICVRRRFTVSEVSYEFSHIPRTVLYEIITLDYAITGFAHYGFRRSSRMHTKRRECIQL
jgi:hypothetical protein